MRRMSGGRYAFAVGWRIAAFVALMLALPAITQALSRSLDCASVKGICWAIPAIGGVLGRPVILGLFALLLIGPTIRRARTLGTTAAIGLIVPLLFLLDWQFLTALGSPWPISLDRGLFNTRLPFFAILGLLIILVLAVARTPDEEQPVRRRHGAVGKAGWVLAALAVLVGGTSVGLNISWLVGMAGEGVSSPLAAYALRLGKIASAFAMLAIVGFAWILFRELFGHGAETEE